MTSGILLYRLVFIFLVTKMSMALLSRPTRLLQHSLRRSRIPSLPLAVHLARQKSISTGKISEFSQNIEVSEKIRDTQFSFLDTLNPNQKMAVTALKDDSLLCISGPGSGKTRVLTSRITYLIKHYQVAPYSIIALTFTNKAAKEMRERLSTSLGDVISSSLTVGTFHSIFAKLLRTMGKAYFDKLKQNNGYPLDTSFTIFDQNDCQAIVGELMDELGFDKKSLKVSTVLSGILEFKQAKALLAAGASATTSAVADIDDKRVATSVAKRIAKELLPLYCERLYSANALDFDDILIYGYQMMRDDPQVRRRVRDRFQYLLVDEYQDTNSLQYEMIKLIVPPTREAIVDTDSGGISPPSYRGLSLQWVTLINPSTVGGEAVQRMWHY